MLFAGPDQVFKLRAFLTLLPGQSQARSAGKLGRVKGLQVTGFRVFSFRVKDLGSFALHQALMGPTRARVQDSRGCPATPFSTGFMPTTLVSRV